MELEEISMPQTLQPKIEHKKEKYSKMPYSLSLISMDCYIPIKETLLDMTLWTPNDPKPRL